MIFKDYYKILDLATNKVSMDEIKVAYRKQAKKYHPDVNIKNRRNEEIFKDINEAYKILSTSSSKRKYDRMWNHYVGRKRSGYTDTKKINSSISNNFFNIFFGSPSNLKDQKSKIKQEMQKGENVQTEVSISIEDAFRGKDQKVALRTVDGNLKTFNIHLPAGVQNNEKIRLIGERKTRQKWWKKWGFVYKNKN